MFKLASSTMFKPVNNHVQACQQLCSSWPAQPACSSLSTTMFEMASSTMFKPVNNHVQDGQLNHVQACQQPACSKWPAQPCSSLSTNCAFLRVILRSRLHIINEQSAISIWCAIETMNCLIKSRWLCLQRSQNQAFYYNRVYIESGLL